MKGYRRMTNGINGSNEIYSQVIYSTSLQKNIDSSFRQEESPVFKNESTYPVSDDIDIDLTQEIFKTVKMYEDNKVFAKNIIESFNNIKNDSDSGLTQGKNTKVTADNVEYNVKFNYKNNSKDISDFSVYDNNSSLIFEYNSDGSTKKYEYDSDGKLTKKTEIPTNGSGANVLEFDSEGNISKLGIITIHSDYTQLTEFEYDSKGNLATKTEIYNSDSYNSAYISDFNSEGKMARSIAVKDKDTEISEFEYDSNGELVKKTITSSNDTIAEYDSKENLIKKTVANKDGSIDEYDGKGQLVRKLISNKDGSIDEYDGNENLVKKTIVSQDGSTEIYENKINNNSDGWQKLTICKKDGSCEERVFDADGNIEKTIYHSDDGNIKVKYINGNVNEYDYLDKKYADLMPALESINMDNVADILNNIELSCNISFEEYLDILPINNKEKEQYIETVYLNLYEKYGFDPDYANENVKIQPQNTMSYNNISYTVKQDGNILSAINNETGAKTSIDVSKLVIGVNTAERIEIYAALQKSSGQLLEFIANNIEYISHVDGLPYGGCYDGIGINIGHKYPGEEVGCLAHEIGHSIDNHYNPKTKKWENYSSEIVGQEPYKTEMANLYATGLFDKYTQGASETEMYAECARYLLGVSNNQAEIDCFEKTIPNFLQYVKDTMLLDSMQPTKYRKQKYNTASLQKYSLALSNYRKTTGNLILKNEKFKSIDVEKEGNTITYNIKYSDGKKETQSYSFVDYKGNQTIVTSKIISSKGVIEREYNPETQDIIAQVETYKNKHTYKKEYNPETGTTTCVHTYPNNSQTIEEWQSKIL